MSSFCATPATRSLRARNFKKRPDHKGEDERKRSLYLYAPETIDLDRVQGLLTAAVNMEGRNRRAVVSEGEEDGPWFFSVVQNKSLLSLLANDSAKLFAPFSVDGDAAAQISVDKSPVWRAVSEAVQDALALITLYSRKGRSDEKSLCWQGAENMIVAASGLDLRANVSAVLVPSLNMRGWKERLGIPDELEAVAPVIIRPLETAVQDRVSLSAA